VFTILHVSIQYVRMRRRPKDLSLSPFSHKNAVPSVKMMRHGNKIISIKRGSVVNAVFFSSQNQVSS
jgi:hypothetical protein